MKNENRFFVRKRADKDKLKSYGFAENEGSFCCQTKLLDEQFLMEIYIKNEVVQTKLWDIENECEYTLHVVSDAQGEFVGRIKAEYEQILTDIADKCFEPDVFKSKQAKEIIAYVRDTYGDELEYLWQKFPDNAVVRRKDNQKWYAALLTVSRKKLGFDTDEKVEILDIRMTPEDIKKSVDGVKFLPGYHMNKKHWVTICLDDTVNMEEICVLIDDSYKLAKK